MKNLKYIDTLLKNNSVEWKTLGEVADYEQPTKYLVDSNNYNDNYKTPVLTAGKTFILGYTDETEGIYKASTNPVIIFDDFTTANKWVDFDFKAKSSAMKMITSKNESIASIKYIYYWLNTLPSELTDGDHKRQWISNFANKQIPIPPLPVQQEIVRILDTFTELTAELTAELKARKKQYAFYREQLLSFEAGEVEWKTLGEVVNMRAGQHISASNIMNIASSEYQFPCFGGNGVRGYVKNKSHNGNHLLIGRQGALCGNVQRFNGEFYATEHAVVVTSNGNISIEYAFHLLTFMNLNQYASKSAQPGLAVSNIERLKIPIPPLAEQARIVAILDKFDVLTTSISEGLPKEIALRQQQYEYYRDRLLTFK